MFNYYLNKLGDIPKFLEKYLKCPSLLRLKKVSYFCGMDYASKDIYNFSEYISRYDHSLSVALLTYKLTNDKIQTISALFHDIGTPCFSHVIDYMNNDYEKQESTEEFNDKIMKNDKYLINCLKKDNIDIEDIINFKKYSIVDNDRPKLCADRLDGIILTGTFWTKDIFKNDINNIIDDIAIFKNEYGEGEIGFKNNLIASKVLEISESIDLYCHSNEDNYMMNLLSIITKYAIDKKYISYEDLYCFDEIKLFDILNNINDIRLNELLDKFYNIKLSQIPSIILPDIKVRNLNPLVNNIRLKSNCMNVVGTLFIDNNKLLLDKPRKRPTYQMIGGKVEKGESIFDATIREAKEELGSSAILDDNKFEFVMSFDEIASSDNKTKIHFNLYKYNGKLEGELSTSSEIESFIWYDTHSSIALSNTLEHVVIPYCINNKLIK